MTTARQIRNVVRAVQRTPWAIEPRKADEIAAVLQLRLDGVQLTAEEVRRRIGADDSIEIDIDGDDAPAEPYQVLDGVAVIGLQGVLAPKINLMMRISGGTSTELFRGAVRQAAADPAVKAILLAVDSPGGSVHGTEEAAAAVREARNQKPVVAVATNLMGSAAYYIGSAAGEVVASPSAALGSIGVYAIHTEFSAADKAAGVKRTLVKRGRYKADGNDTEPLSDQARQTLQEEIDAYYELMVESIATNRGVDVATVEQNFGQGKVLIASKAVAAGLADRTGTLDETLEALIARVNPTQSDPTEPPYPATGAQQMDPRIRQALLHRGLLSAEAADETADALLTALFAATGQAVPTDPEAILEALKPPTGAPLGAGLLTPPASSGGQTQSSTSPTSTSSSADPSPLPTTLQQTDPGVAAAAAAAERQRITDIQARATLLGLAPDDPQIAAAIAAGTSVPNFVDQAVAGLAPREGSVEPVPGKAQADKFHDAAIAALEFHCGLSTDESALSASARELRHCSALEMAKDSLRQSIGRAPIGDPDTIARAALGDPEALHILGADFPAQTPGDFPNILSGLANKALAAAPPFVGTTYQLWAHRHPPVPDFRPNTLAGIGEFGEFPLHVDGDTFEQSELAEDYSWLQVDSYGDEFGLTPRMIVDDNLGAFTDALGDKKAAHDQTLNRLCVNLLTGNVACSDGIALYNLASHNNDRPAGAAPSTAELSAMRLLLRQQTGLGGRKLSFTINLLLVPEDLETGTEQLLNVSLAVNPVTVVNAEPFRGKVRWAVEPMLAAHSTAQYYGFADPARARSIVYAHQKGFEKMKVRRYFNPQNNCLFHQFEGRFCAAVRTWRGTVRNAGAGG